MENFHLASTENPFIKTETGLKNSKDAFKPGGLDLSRRGLDLDRREFSTALKSRSRWSRLVSAVQTRTAWAVFRNCGTRLYPQEGLKIRLKT